MLSSLTFIAYCTGMGLYTGPDMLFYIMETILLLFFK